MRYRLIKYSAWAALFWERLWRAIWPAVALFVGLVALTLLNVWQALPPFLGGVGLALYLAVMVVTLGAGLWTMQLPSHAQVLRWLEKRHGLRHRPLALTEDRQATAASRSSDILWHEQKQRAGETTRRLAPKMPSPGVAARDPWAMRILAVLLLFVAILAGGREWRDSLGFLISPFGYPEEEASLTAWLDPPQYTRKPPRSLSAPGNEGEAATIMDVPEGTVLNVRVNGPRRTPILTATDGRRAMAQDEPRSYTLSYTLSESGEYELVSGGRVLGLWRFDVTPDMPPSITFAAEPAVTVRDSLHIAYAVEDDYGVTEGELLITRSGTDEELRLPLSLPAAAPGRLEGSVYENLVSHPWAGTPVLATLLARDGPGQEGRSETIAFTLPERQFTHPVAKELVDLRKLLSTEDETADYVSRQLGLMSLRPERFDEDLVAYMAIRTAAYRVTAPNPDTVNDMVGLMWDTAVRIEDGAAGLAEENMRQAMQKMMDALSKDGTDSQEMQQLMQELQKAMADYMQALAEQQQKTGQQDGQEQRQAGNASQTNPQMLQDMLQQVQNLAELGSMEDARKMLSELQAMMENMSVASEQQQQDARQAEAMRQALNQMRQRQQQIMDETYHQAGEQAPSSRSPESAATQGLRDRQEELRSGLMSANEQMNGEGAPGSDAIENAINSMARAEQELNGGKLEDAVISQAQAIQSLAEAENALSQQGNQAEQRGSGEGGNQGMGEADPSRSVVPAESELGRAREILDEIRRRAGDWDRPEVERRYLDRLLERF